MKIQLKFEPRDIWIGVYWTITSNVLNVYICIVPLFPIHVQFTLGSEQDAPTYENETDPETLRTQRNAWQETARAYAKDAEYHRTKRFALLKWLRDTSKTYVDINPIVPQEFKDDFTLLEESEG